MKENNNFFKELKRYNLLDNYVDILDWLLDDKKFNLWNSEMKKKYTNKIKEYTEKNFILFKNKKSKELQKINNINKKLYIYFTTKDSQSVSCIKHIRNGIAHGNCQVKTKSSKICLTMKDYNMNKKISALIYIPLDLLIYLYNSYNEITDLFNKK